MSSLLVSDFMTAEVEVIFDDEQVDIAGTIMTLSRIRHLPVTDRGDRLVGLLTQRDLLARVVSHGVEAPVLVRDIMTKKVTTIAATAPIQRAARIMLENKYGCLIVTEAQRITGILTETDFVDFVASNAERWE